MKNTAIIILLASIFNFPFSIFHSSAAVTLKWQVETSRLQPVVFDAVRGETLALEAFFNSYGNPLSMAERTYSVFYQTNGMGSAWWTAPATVSSNTVCATITPYMVPSSGTSTYPVTLNGFLGSTGDIYRAAFTIRFRNGPGATPNVIDVPVPILDLAHTVVINPPWPTQADFASTTTVMRTELKTYVDEQIGGAGVVSPSIVTNISGRVTSNVVTKAYVESLGIEAGISGNSATSIVDRIVASSNLATVAALDGKLDAWNEDHTQHIYWDSDILNFSYGISVNASPTMFPAELNGFYFGDTTMEQLLDAKANVEDAYPATSGNQLASQVSTIGAHLNAEDARFVSTNYNSATHMPEAYVEIKLTNNTWSTIWREMTRFNWLTNTYLPTNYASKAELDEKADRAWGYYDSHTGSYTPDGYTWISSPRIAIAAGLAYQRTVTSEGAVWVLESNGLVTQTGGETNGFFRITDEEGNTQFEIVKGNKRTIGADASSCEVVAGFSPTKLQIGYSIQSDIHPTIEVTSTLSSPSWKSETDADCLANVTWSGASGAYVAHVQAKTAQTSLFVRATYQTGGETYINNAAPVALNYLYLDGVKYAVSTNMISGHLVLTLTPSL